MDEIDGFLRDLSARSPTYYPEAPTNSVSRTQVEALKTIAAASGGVARLCLHSSSEAGMHTMVIAQTQERYWRPKKHLTKIKTFNVLEGRMAVVVFADSGFAQSLTLLEHESRPLMVIAPASFHTNVALTQMCVHVETIQGPYSDGEPDRVVALFAPDEQDTDSGKSFVSDAIGRLSSQGS